MSRFEAVIFDKDGTLFDFGATWEGWAVSFLTRMCGGDRVGAARVGQAIGFDLPARRFAPDSVAIAGTPEQVAAAVEPHFPGMSHAAIVATINEEAARAPQAEAVPLAPLLDRLRAARLRLGLITNDAERPARAHLDSVGVRDRFDFVAGSDSGFGAKPGPGQLLAFCKAFGIAPGRCVMVGDSLHDLHAGRAAGMSTVAVLTGIAVAATLRPAADVVLPDIGHLPAWLWPAPAVTT